MHHSSAVATQITEMKKKLPELLSPAGSMESLRAALAAGADAVYSFFISAGGKELLSLPVCQLAAVTLAKRSVKLNAADVDSPELFHVV